MKKFMLVTLALALFNLPVWATFAAEKISLSLPRAIEMALKTSEDVMMRSNEIEKTSSRIREAWAAAYPHFEGKIEYKWYPSTYKFNIDPASFGMPAGDPISVSTQEDFDLAFGITLNQLIYSFGRVKNGVEAAKNGKKATELALSVARKEMSYNTALAYLSVILAQKAHKIMQDSYDNAKKNLEVLNQRFSFGRVPKGDFIKMSADIAGRVPPLKKTQSTLDLTKRTLKMLIGVDENTELELSDTFIVDFPSYGVDEFLEKMLEVEPSLRALRTNVNLYRNIESLMWAEYLPVINAFIDYNYLGVSGNWYIGGSNFQHVATTGLTLSIPIWDGGKTTSVHKQAKVDRMNAELELQKATRGLSLELRNTLAQLNSLKETYEANKESVRLSEQSYRATLDRFRSGEQTAAELNDGEMWLTSTKADKVTTLFEINKLIAKVEKLTAGPGDRSWMERLNFKGAE